jgi:SAM-dependent methyltransferase
MRPTAKYWDLAAEDYLNGREVFPDDAGTVWFRDGSRTIDHSVLGDLDCKTLLEVGCGHGMAVRSLGMLFPKARFIGLDFSRGQIALAKSLTADVGNAEFYLHDALGGLSLNLPPYDELLSIYGAFDFIEYPKSAIESFIGGLSEFGACSILTSSEAVREAVLMSSSLRIFNEIAVEGKWFLRGRVNR